MAKGAEGNESEILSIARHDFKTPLTSLRMLAQLFKLGLEKGTLNAQPERTAHHCQLIMDQVDRLSTMADILFEISKIESGRWTVDRQDADLRHVIQAALVHAQGEVLGVSLPESPLNALVDVDKMIFALRLIISKSKSLKVMANKIDIKISIEIQGDLLTDPSKDIPSSFIIERILGAHESSLEMMHENGTCRISIPALQQRTHDLGASL